MFFLLRSAACIGLVMAALPGGGRALPERSAVVALSGRLATEAAGSLCRLAPSRCIDVAAFGSGAVEREHFDKPSRDTLQANDRRPSWAGPVMVSSN